MIIHNVYLSDEELKELMSDAEADILPAPPELTEKIIKAIQTEVLPDKKGKTKTVKSKKQEYIAYCFRVSTIVAAAVAFIFIMPNLPEFQIGDMSFLYESAFYKELDTWYSNEYEEMRDNEYVKLTSYPTKEEVLKDAGFIQKIPETGDIFNENESDNSLKENGGN